MDINLTIVGEAITFAILIWVTMRYIWPPIKNAMHERETKIADGLAAADRGQHSLELAQEKVKKQLQDAKMEAANIIDNANQRMGKIIDDAKERADEEGKHILLMAKKDIAFEMENAKLSLRAEMADLLVVAAQKLLQQTWNADKDKQLVQQIIEEL
ncbi:MAG: F0F1 ATP synthase subunit B [Gammaproteobacteria bacterium]|nr:F0F1 ATP synthase subunit B [Gammaproteobacteria bacterium]